jgi:uncharacterized integral membrane protein (TIGR00697 family)
MQSLESPNLLPEIAVRSRLLSLLTAVFVTALIVADITGGKFFHLQLFRLGSYEFVTHSVGMLAFPITFLLTDLINEYYGPKVARQVTYIGLLCAGLSFGLILVDRQLPVAPESPIAQDTFEKVFAMSNRLYVASLSAYLVGQMSDIAVFGVLKRLTGGRMVWLRATGSTVISQAIDSFCVTTILFYGNPGPDGQIAGWQVILPIAATGYVLKFMLAIALTPVVYLGRWLIRTRLGMLPLPAEPATRTS